MDIRRSERVASAMREELEEILNYEMNDPRLSTVVVEEVILSPDGKKAVARVTPEGGENAQNEAMAALAGASRHIRSVLAGRLDIYRPPDIEFHSALAPESAAKAPQLLRRMHRGRPRE